MDAAAVRWQQGLKPLLWLCPCVQCLGWDNWNAGWAHLGLPPSPVSPSVCLSLPLSPCSLRVSPSQCGFFTWSLRVTGLFTWQLRAPKSAKTSLRLRPRIGAASLGPDVSVKVSHRARVGGAQAGGEFQAWGPSEPLLGQATTPASMSVPQSQPHHAPLFATSITIFIKSKHPPIAKYVSLTKINCHEPRSQHDKCQAENLEPELLWFYCWATWIQHHHSWNLSISCR